MKQSILFLLLLCSSYASAQQTWSDRSRILPDQLRGVPTGITLFHSPSPVWPTANNEQAAYLGKYVWKHSTSAFSIVGDLRVVSAGSYIWLKDKGWMPNMRLDSADFEKYFACPKALLRNMKHYTFSKNYRYGDALYGGDALWFILAYDKKGKLFKGVAIVETEGKLIDK